MISRNKTLNPLALIVLLIVTAISCQPGLSTDRQAKLDIAPVFNIKSTAELHRFFTHRPNSYPMVSAHRGGPTAGFPENALATFAHVASQMPTIIECDIRLTKDSVLVLMHDASIDRTTTGSGVLSTLSYADLETYRLVDNDGNETTFKIPTLEEALLWGKNRVIYTLDVKRNVPYKLVVDMIRKTQSQANVIVITYNADQAELVNRLAPDLLISASIRQAEDLARLEDRGIPDNRLVAFVGVSEPDSTLYARLNHHGIRTILGTMGNLDTQAAQNGHQIYADLIERGADILSTDRPFEAYKALKFYIDKRGITSSYILN